MTKNIQSKNLAIVQSAKAYYHSSLHLYITNHKGRHRDNTSEDCETDNPHSATEIVKCQEWFAFIGSNLSTNLELITVADVTCYMWRITWEPTNWRVNQKGGSCVWQSSPCYP